MRNSFHHMFVNLYSLHTELNMCKREIKYFCIVFRKDLIIAKSSVKKHYLIFIVIIDCIDCLLCVYSCDIKQEALRSFVIHLSINAELNQFS